MNFNDLFKNEPSTILAIRAEQLKEVIDYAVAKTKSEFQTTQDPERYLTPKQTAKDLDVDLSTLWRWEKNDYLVPVRIGCKPRYKLSDVQRILKGVDYGNK